MKTTGKPFFYTILCSYAYIRSLSMSVFGPMSLHLTQPCSHFEHNPCDSLHGLENYISAGSCSTLTCLINISLSLKLEYDIKEYICAVRGQIYGQENCCNHPARKQIKYCPYRETNSKYSLRISKPVMVEVSKSGLRYRERCHHRS